MNRTYKAIIFDLDNTLLDYSLSERDSMRRTVKQHNVLADEEAEWDLFWENYSKHNFKHWMDFVHKLGSPKTIEEVLIHSFRDTLNREHSEHEKLSNTYWEFFCNTCYFENGAEDVLLALKEKYKLGIISNGIDRAQRKRLAAGNVFELFQSIVVSDEAGVRKPSKEIFDLSLGQLRMHRSEVLFIGDSLSDDYHGAKNAEIDFCLYNRDKKPISDEYRPKYAITELRELMGII